MHVLLRLSVYFYIQVFAYALKYVQEPNQYASMSMQDLDKCRRRLN